MAEALARDRIRLSWAFYVDGLHGSYAFYRRSSMENERARFAAELIAARRG
jgi:hypothetical protein